MPIHLAIQTEFYPGSAIRWLFHLFCTYLGLPLRSLALAQGGTGARALWFLIFRTVSDAANHRLRAPSPTKIITRPSLRPPSVHVLPSRLGARVSGGENRRQSSLRLRGLFLHESVEKVLLVARELWLPFSGEKVHICCTVSLNLKRALSEMEAETLPDSTTTASVVHFAATDGGRPPGTQSETATIGMDVDAAFPDLFLSNEQVRNRRPGKAV